MSTPHLTKCLCHGYVFWGHVHEGSQSTADLQAGTSAIDLERIYGSGDRQTLSESSNISDSFVHPGALVVVPAPPSVNVLGPRLPPQCSCGLCGGLDVPQRLYQSVQTSPNLDHRSDGETLGFSKGGCGVRVIDAIENRLSGLVGGDDLMFVRAAVSTFSLRIEWPGYRMWTGKFRAKSWGGTNGPVTRSRLVAQLGKRIAEFVEAMEDVECGDLAWKVGSKNVKVDNIVLVSLTRVSKGSWQPLLRLLA